MPMQLAIAIRLPLLTTIVLKKNWIWAFFHIGFWMLEHINSCVLFKTYEQTQFERDQKAPLTDLTTQNLTGFYDFSRCCTFHFHQDVTNHMDRYLLYFF